MLFSIRLQFHLGPVPNLFYTSKVPSCMLTSVLFKLMNCIFEEYKLKKEIIFLRKNIGSYNSPLINFIKINCYTCKYILKIQNMEKDNRNLQ